MELVERCMVQVHKRDVKIKIIRMHDLMRDLCLSMAKQESFLFIVDQSNASSLSIIRKVRRVSSRKSFWLQCIKSPNLRSLLFFDEFIPEDHEDFSNPLFLFWVCLILCCGVVLPSCDPIVRLWRHMCNNFRLLRVLDFEGGTADGGCKLPYDIGNLIHLRFLSVRGLRFWWRELLPSSLGNLRCLQTLDLRLGDGAVYFVHVPNVIWRMDQLRHLYLPKDCTNKKRLKLATLRKLQTLVNFNSKNCHVEDLINMTYLRDLVIFGPFENAEELDKNPPIIEGRYLHSLSIINYGIINPRHLNHLLSRFLSLCKLSSDDKISELPKYDQFSSDLAYIKLRRCMLQADPMPTLEKLPNLRILKLQFGDLITNKIVCSAQGFPKLESLKLKQLYFLEEWNVDEGSMPCLRLLEINECLGMKMVPDGLRFITTLQELKIKLMPKELKDKLVEGGEDFYKVQYGSIFLLSYSKVNLSSQANCFQDFIAGK